MGDDPASFELTESLGEQGPAGPGDATMDLVEATRPDHQLADDQRRPTVAQNVDRGRYRAVLPATSHPSSVLLVDATR